jgi:hypothetical protein
MRLPNFSWRGRAGSGVPFSTVVAAPPHSTTLGMMSRPLQHKCASRLLGFIFLCATYGHAAGDDARYQEIERLIKHNRHLSGHLVLAVDARTIKAVRTKVNEKDIPVLVQMMGDKDYGVASAASDLLVTLGKQAMPALREAMRTQNSSIVNQAQGALRLLEDCYNEELRDVMNPDVCPTDRPGGRPQGRRR